MDGLVTGRVAVVTGGGRGIGRAACLELARHGADVVVADLNGTTAAVVAGEIEALGRRAVSLAADVGAAAGRQAIFDGAVALGPVDILVNNAGILQVIDAFALSEADWDHMLAINAKSVFFMCQLVLPGMLQRRRGAIVNLASIAGKTAGNPVLAHYNASKAAVIAITKTWARIAAPHGVRVNCVCPGVIDTDMWTRLGHDWGAMVAKSTEAMWHDTVAGVPMGRGGTPEDVARVVTFLASDMAGYMTGQAVNVSGGLVTY